MAWWLQKWDLIRNSLWFFPTVGIILAVILSNTMVGVDHLIAAENIDALSVFVTTESAARATLGSLAGALITVTGVVFSVTMLTLAQTSSQFGSRLLRSFLSHNVSQVTLGIFLGTSLYCFGVLRTVRSIGDTTVFVPHLSVAIGMVLGLLSLITFISFIHHVVQSIQVESVVESVSEELDSAIDRLFPERFGKDSTEVEEVVGDIYSPKFDEGFEILSDQVGYLQGVDGEFLLEIATKNDFQVKVDVIPGDYIFRGCPIAHVNRAGVDEDCQTQIKNCFLTGIRRTPRQDINCVVRELAEVAIRALSPGINDPHTATICIDYLTAAMCKLLRRDKPETSRRDQDGNVRVVTAPITFELVLEEAFGEILFYGRESVVILNHLANSVVTMQRNACRQEDQEALKTFLELIKNSAQRNLEEPIHRKRVEAVLDQTCSGKKSDAKSDGS